MTVHEGTTAGGSLLRDRGKLIRMSEFLRRETRLVSEQQQFCERYLKYQVCIASPLAP